MELNIQNAVDATGFGKFNFKVMLLCGLIYLNTAFSISSIGLVLPSAACDFRMNTIDKGRISAVPMLGMMCGSYFWGCFADLKGRKIALMAALLFHGGFEFITAFVPNYWTFVFFKYISGFAISGQSGLVFTYLGEFQPSKYRERILCWLEMAWTFGLIIIPLVGWVIIPLNINLSMKPFFFHSWNLFVLICSFPSIIIGIWIIFFPETPKYLVESEDLTELTRVLLMIHFENTGKTAQDYFEGLEKSGNPIESEILRLAIDNPNHKKGQIEKRSWEKMIQILYVQTFTLFKPKYLRRTLCICLLMLYATSSYYALMLWFPEVFQRFAEYEKLYPGNTASVCEVSKQLRTYNETAKAEKGMLDCQVSEIKTEVFSNTLILGLACIPMSIVLPLTINRVGYKFYLIVCSLISTAVTVGLVFVRTSTENLILSCFYESLLSVCVGLVFCIIVDIYPTNLRVIAAALAAFCGRLGALLGNSLFGYLIDDHCFTLITLIGAELVGFAIVGLLIPIKRPTKGELSTTNTNNST